jgi:tryptophan synthase alpha chain
VSADLAATLDAAQERGRRAFVPYVTGGLPGVDGGLLRALADAGADAIEIGLPFSDPVMDGPVIQEASRRALEDGATPAAVLELAAASAPGVPIVVMTYLNPVLAYGPESFARDAAAAGVTGLIVPDLPVDEAEQWGETLERRGISGVLLAAPNASPERLRRIAAAARGFVYCVSTLGVTGARTALADSARAMVDALRPMTDIPLLVGVGISTPEHARAVAAFADGVIVGSALVKPLLEKDRSGVLRRARSIREALDEQPP